MSEKVRMNFFTHIPRSLVISDVSEDLRLTWLTVKLYQRARNIIVMPVGRYIR